MSVCSRRGVGTAVAVMAAVAAALVAGSRREARGQEPSPGPGTPAAVSSPRAGLERATFAGGCFWCMEPPFEKLAGVLSVTSGYTGGQRVNPTYHEVSSGGTGHAEAVEVVFDPRVVSYEKLLDVFWHNVDPTVRNRQFCDVGEQYRTAIFTHGPEQRRLAEESKRQLEKTKPFPAAIVTPIEPAATFYAAEDYHQDYYKKNPIRYRFYRYNCGRDARLSELWGDKAGSH